MSSENAIVLRDGWLHTGDMARMDEDGYFWSVDRKKDMIIGASGLSVYPREVEEVPHLYPRVKACGVIGTLVSLDKGERLKSIVVPKEGETATEEEIIASCSENLSMYKVPRFVEFRDEVPVTMLGKVLRCVLLEEEQRKRASPQQA